MKDKKKSLVMLIAGLVLIVLSLLFINWGNLKNVRAQSTASYTEKWSASKILGWSGSSNGQGLVGRVFTSDNQLTDDPNVPADQKGFIGVYGVFTGSGVGAAGLVTVTEWTVSGSITP